MTKKSLCVVTGTRAEYGLLRPVLQKLLQSDVIEPRLVVTGAHLAPEFGNTVSEIEARRHAHRGAHPHPEVRHRLSAGYCAHRQLYDGALYRLFQPKPSRRGACAGDRYEIFAAGAAAALLEIPLAHISAVT